MLTAVSTLSPNPTENGPDHSLHSLRFRRRRLAGSTEPLLDRRAFVRTGDRIEALEIRGASFTEAFAINDRGRIVGQFLGEDGPGAAITAAAGINARGDRRPVLDENFARHGFLLADGEYLTIDVPGQPETIALGINNRGDILGTYEDENNGAHGYVLRYGAFEYLDVAPGVPTQLNRINDRGKIVGYDFRADGTLFGGVFR